MISRIYTLKPLDEGADPATFYAPLGCTSNEGRLYRRSVQDRGTTEELQAAWDVQETRQVEVCFFSIEDGLSGWRRSGLVMGRGWFAPISAEAILALDAYMDELEPVSAVTRDLGYKNAGLFGARSRLKLLVSSNTETDDLLGQGSPKQREAARDIAGLEANVARLESVLKHAEAKRQEAQDVLLIALGWEALAKTERGNDDG